MKRNAIRLRRSLPPGVRSVHARQLPLPPPFAPPSPAGGACQPLTTPLTVLTIGHGNQGSGAFLALLRQHDIATVADVRSVPYSRYAPHFGRDALRTLLETAGIRYVWAGERLGGRPRDPACYRDGIVRVGNVDYEAMARQPAFREGVALLLAEGTRGAVAVMCSEEDPRRCHRHRLIESSLRELGVNVLHIRRNGSLETIDVGERAAPAEPSPQLVLEGFGA